jgi:hypothetical protein
MERRSGSSDGEEKGGKQRLQFDFTYKEVLQLDELVKLMGATSRAEALRRVLAMAEHVIRAQGSGGWTEVRPKDGPPRRIVFSCEPFGSRRQP